MKVLIVDDHAIVRRGLREIVEERYPGAVVGEASDTAGAVGAALDGDWDLVLLDLALPGRGGIEVLARIRASRPKLPVLVLSMQPEDPFGARVIRAGASGFVNKASAPEALVGAIERVLAGGRYIGPGLAETLANTLQAGVDPATPLGLSHREFQVLCRLGAGRSVGEIADEMSLSVKTVSTYRTRLLAKLGLRTTAELIRYAIEYDLVRQAPAGAAPIVPGHRA